MLVQRVAHDARTIEVNSHKCPQKRTLISRARRCGAACDYDKVVGLGQQNDLAEHEV